MSNNLKNYKSIFKPNLFRDDVVLVTGGGSGIGRCIAHELASLGATVIIAGRKLDKLEKTAKEIKSLGHKVDIEQLNIRDFSQAEIVIKRIVKKHGNITCLVNNAGGQFSLPAREISENGWKSVVDLNLNGTWNMCLSCYRHGGMQENGGRIVNVVADVRNGFPFMGHSGAARAGVINLTKTLCVEWGPSSGIRINAVAPGTVISSGMDNYPKEMNELTLRDHWKNPTGRFATESEVSSAVVYLLSPAASFINGALLPVDGGGSLFKQGQSVRFSQESKIVPYDGGLKAEISEQFAQLLEQYAKIGKKKTGSKL